MIRVILKYINIYFNFFNVLGLLLQIKGKIGLGGNSKKKRFKLLSGKLKLNNKYLKLSYDSTNCRTDSGSLGIKYLITYA